MKQQVNILVVDDNKDLLNTFALILKRKGYIVDTAEDGMQAINKFTAHHYDIVLMDVKMPQIGGLEALHRMKEYDPKARIILMTAYLDETQLKQAIQEGACGALYKPVNIPKLMEMIGEAPKDPSILIVDDDDDFRFTMSRMMEVYNYQVLSAVSGEDALRIARLRAVNMAFVDIKMKGMDGLETSIKLKEIRPDMIIILMTGYRDEAEPIIVKAKEKGVVTCLYKPFRMADVRQLVRQTS